MGVRWYYCRDCGRRFSYVQTYNSDGPNHCNFCHSSDIKRIPVWRAYNDRS